MSLRPHAAINENAVTVPIYAPDPFGGAFFAAVSSAIANGINGARAVIDTRGTLGGTATSFMGWARSPQRFRGAAALGTGRVYAPKAGELNDERTSLDANARAIFASRSARR